MTTKNYILSKKAQIHLNQIKEYTVEKFGSSQWNKYKKILIQGFETIATHSDIGIHCDDILPNANRYKAGYHNVYFTIKEKEILIVAILSDYQLPENHL